MSRAGKIILAWAALSAAGIPARARADEAVNADATSRIKVGTSLAPLIAYDPTYGFILGLAIFGGRTGDAPTKYSLIFFGTTQGNFGVDSQAKTWLGSNWYFSRHFAANNLYVPFYGEGNATRLEDRVDIGTRWLEWIPSLGYRWSRQLSLEAFPELSFRSETSVAGDTSRRLYGRDFTPALGAMLAWDERDNEVDPHQGGYHALKVRYGPGAWSTRAGAHDFVQADLENDVYVPVRPGSTLAAQALAGTTSADPGFLYRFSLGTDRVLRGYRKDRFRGNHYYAGQLEWRQEVLPMLSFAAFAAAGDVADQRLSDFGSPKWTYGPGVRYALPPDRVAKLRLDYGFATNGESALYLNFNEAF